MLAIRFESILLRLDVERPATDRSRALVPITLAELSVRHRRAELMDDPALDPAAHARALRGLGRINRLSRSGAILWPPIAAIARVAGAGTIRVLDVASGGGDVVLGLSKRATRVGLNVTFDGSDVSAAAVKIAEANAAEKGHPLRFRQLDVLTESIPDGYDVVMCSLFLHHLDDDQAVSVLAKMAAPARRLVLVNDLIRGPAGYLLAVVGCHVLSSSPIVHYDGPVSVAGAYTIAEASGLAARAGLVGARFSRHWPCRFLMSWSRPL